MNTKTLITLLITALTLPLASQANPGEPGQGGPRERGQRPDPAEIFQRMDADESGGISQDEARGPLARKFDKLDTDESGELSLEEFQAGHKQRRGLRDADTDDNGSISVKEATAAEMTHLVENFDKLDADGDGELTRQELREARKVMAQERRKGPPPSDEVEDEE